jgi:hypothetical protein
LFINKLKSFLKQEKGPYITDQLTLCLPFHYYDQKQSQQDRTGSNLGTTAAPAALDLDIDLIKMIHFDQFLADNFIRCFFRYYPKLSQYVKDVFLEGYCSQAIAQIKESAIN